jgi:hypothetical protein
MLSLEGYVHRDRLAEIIRRWMVNRPEPGDVRRLKEIVNFNNHIARLWLSNLGARVLDRFRATPVIWMPIRSKGQLKDFAVEHLTYSNERIEAMCAHYRSYPEDYYRETPIDGGIYVAPGQNHFLGSDRLKRSRRIAEKGARRMVDYMLGRIRANADALADERARGLGVTRAELTTPPEQMVEEFLHAERRLLKAFRRGTIEQELPLLVIPDLAGLKVIAEDREHGRLLDSLEATGNCDIIESEHHSGDYNATNLLVSHKLPFDLLMSNPPRGHALRTFAYRGFDPETVELTYRDFLATAESTVSLEIIVSNFEDFLESEIGRSMHEERVLHQRSHGDYNGHMATNARYLMDYILNRCRAPDMREVEDVPIKLWVKYMPDTMEHLVRDMHTSGSVRLELFRDEYNRAVNDSISTTVGKERLE